MLLLGGVDEMQDQPRHLAVGVLHGAGVKGRHQIAGTGARHAHLQVNGRHGGHHHLGQLPRRVVAVFQADAIGERPADQRLAVQAQKLQERPVALGHVALQVKERDANGRLVEQPAHALHRTRQAVGIGKGRHVAQYHRAAVSKTAIGVILLRLRQIGAEGAAVAPAQRDLAMTARIRVAAAGADHEFGKENLISVQFPAIEGHHRARV